MRPRGVARALLGGALAAALCLVLAACAADGGRPEVSASGTWDVGIGGRW